MVLHNIRNWIIFLLPLVLVMVTSSICKIGKEAGSNVKSRPPGYVFGIAWTILLLLLGLAWVHALEVNDEISKNHVYWFYGLLTISLMMWIILYGCGKNSLAATWTIIISIMLALQSYTVGSNSSKLLISPLIAWLIFALMMGMQEQQFKLTP